MKCPRRRGFTLVELLVVIGIIALLIAILLPVLNKARQAGQAAVCLSRLHEFHQGTKLWQQDNKGRPFPGGGWRGNLARYMKDNKIYLCPADDFPFSSGVDTLLIDIKEQPYDMALDEGPMVHKQVVSNTSYKLYFDDAPDTNHGDQDYNDIVMQVDTMPDGSLKVSVVSLDAGYHYDLVDAKTRQVYLYDLGRGSGPGSSYTVMGGLASYAFNVDSDKIYKQNAKVLALDYFKSAANADADNWSTVPMSHGGPTFARHNSGVNVLWTDGSAKWTPLKMIEPNPINARQYWHKTQ